MEKHSNRFQPTETLLWLWGRGVRLSGDFREETYMYIGRVEKEGRSGEVDIAAPL